MRIESVLILFFSVHVISLGNYFACAAHVPVVERAPEAVVNHRIDGLAGTHSVSLSRVLQKIGCARHRFHAAGYRDINFAQLYSVRREHYRLEAGATDFVDRKSAHAIWNSCAKGHLSRR